jgi:hypothetical protein
MKPPPLLLGSALLFWGWQTGFLIPGAIMAAGLEGARLIKARWEFSDQDFARIWTFCSLVFLGSAVYAFTANEGPADFRGLFQNPNLLAQRNAGVATARTAAALFRWVPMVFFLFVAAQAYSSREGVPLETISHILRRRWKRARKLGQPLPAGRVVNVSYPYFVVCLFAASIHPGEDSTFFWGLCVLAAWALWAQRSRRFGIAAWAAALAAAIVLGYFGQRGISQVQRYLESFSPRWLAGFSRRGFDPTRSQTALGQVGRLKLSGNIVIRLEPKPGSAPPPKLLREASYRAYRGHAWYAAVSQNDFESVYEEANRGTFLLLPGKTNLAAVSIGCYLPGGNGLLPLPAGSGRLENLAAFGLRKNSLGAVLATGPGLVVFDAHYGPGATIDSAPDDQQDRDVPDREAPALNQILAELQLNGLEREEKLRRIRSFFADKFTYSTWQEPDKLASTNETTLSRFLLRTRSGHCEYFATAGVLLLRQARIPARYAVGYAVHEKSGGKFVVRQRDAHAWCLVWNEHARLWQDFDLTPASWVATEANQASPLQFLSDGWSRLWFEFSKFRWGQTHLRQYLLWSLAPVLAVLFYQIVFRSRRRRRREQAGADTAVAWPGLDSEFYQLERKVAERGLARQPSEPLSEWLQRAVDDPALADIKASLQELLWLHYRYRFDPQGLSPDEREALTRQAKACLTKVDEAPVR